jgi:hypothetical protein
MTASIGQLLNVTFTLATPGSLRAAAAACITVDAAAPLVGVGNYPNCPGSSAAAAAAAAPQAGSASAVLPKLVNLVRPSCIDGQYSVMVRVPNAFTAKKCFSIGVQLADGTNKRSIITVTE